MTALTRKRYAGYGATVVLRRPAATAEMPTVFYIRPPLPARAIGSASIPQPERRGFEWGFAPWLAWSLVDRLLLPLALILAGSTGPTTGPGVHRRRPPARHARTRTTRTTGGTTR